MKLGSLFDGSGGFPLAGCKNGISPAWAAEVEPYPVAVTRSRFPHMMHLGDVSKLNGAELEPVDIITFGSPCQDMSIAGKRSGLLHEAHGADETTRSGLFYEAIRIAEEMRDMTNGEYPKYLVWENVPGAFSSNKGRDFYEVVKAFCATADGRVSIPQPPRGGANQFVWGNSGSVVGNGWSFAWRSYDAQYWGVPQRRLRIYAVLDFVDERAGEILFKPDSLRGDYPTGDAAREETASDAMGRAHRGAGTWPLTARTLEARHDSSPCIDRGQNIVIQAAGFKAGQSAAGGIGYASEQMPTLTAEMSGTEPTTVYALQGNGIDRSEHAGCNGCGWREDESYTLNTIDRHGVCNGTDARNGCLNYETEPTIQAKANGGFSHNCIGPVLFDARGGGDGTTACTVTGDHNNRITDYTNVACYRQSRFGQFEKDDGTTSALKQRDYKDATDLVVESGKPKRKYIVRRLTPTECARLQGFPDWWGVLSEYDGNDSFWENVRKTHAEIGGKQYRPSKDIRSWYEKLHTDSAEYKMWGNGIALPCAVHVLRGIVLNERSRNEH